MKMKPTQSRIRAFQSFFGAGLLSLLALVATIPASLAGIEAVQVATGFNTPLYVCAPPGDTSRIFVAEQHGLIRIVNLPSGTVNATPYLDLTDRVGQGQGPGILGMTFDPDYATNGFVYVSWTSAGDGIYNSGISYVARYTVTADPDVADRDTEVKIISADQPDTDHDFDWIGFSNRPGDEGNLYICTGDGGGLNDNAPNHLKPYGNAQSTEILLGKVLRIHIEADGSYTIPIDNPFFGDPAPTKQEIWTYGHRNPFRASFDSATGDLLIGDVGETKREEIDVQPASNPGGGENYGWRYREGTIPNPRFDGDPLPP
ncbi:MAG: PQQ-dependent sugar dehydrogenase, partial [Spartobacteria bacterium]